MPAGALVRLGTLRLWQGVPVRAIAFSPDGRMLACSGRYVNQPEAIHLWEVATGREIYRLPGGASHLAFSWDSSLLAAIDESDFLTIWEVASGKQKWRWEPELVRKQPQPRLNGAAFTPDGKSIAVAVNDITIRLRDVGTGEEKVCWTEWATGLAYSPDGKMLASFSANNVALSHPRSGQRRHTLTLPQRVLSLAFSPDSRRLAIRLARNWVVLWDTVAGKEIARLNAPGIGSPIAFSRDGKTVSTGDWSYDLNTGLEKRVAALARDRPTEPGPLALEVIQSALALGEEALSQDGRLLTAERHGSLYVWDVAKGQEAATL